MKYLVCLCFCVIFCTIGGQINGDPAPGRSPGPPVYDYDEPNHRQFQNNDTKRKTDDNDDDDLLPSLSTNKLIKIIKNETDTSGEISNNNILLEDNDWRHQQQLSNGQDGFATVSDSSHNRNVSSDEVIRQVRPLPNKSETIKCKSSAEAYMLPEEKIINTNEFINNGLPIKVHVKHDLFETAPGLVNKILYTGEFFFF